MNHLNIWTMAVSQSYIMYLSYV